MTPEEAGSFEKELTSRQGLKEEFEQVSAAYKLIREELQNRDEEKFKRRLGELMEQAPTGKEPSGLPGKKGLYYLLPVAASLAIVLSIFFSRNSGDKLFSSYYHP